VCPDNETLLAFIQGQPGTGGQQIEAHLAACSGCAEVAIWAAAHLVNSREARPAPPRAQLASGSRVGRYQILDMIGRGGMGQVYAAYHPDLDRKIALKVVDGDGEADPQRQRMLLREAQIIARLNHPNIVTVHDAGIVGDRVYVAMEFIDGQTIAAWLDDGKRSWREAVEVFLAAGRGLAAAHAADVVHRDFKPQNVMIGNDGRVRVADFGLARPLKQPAEMGSPTNSVQATESLLSTTIGVVVGTPAYMAPEQLRGGKADARSDQFSFCVALHEAIHGVRPGTGAGSSSRGRGAPAWLKAVIRRGLEVDPEQRFASMHQLLRTLERGRSRLRRNVAAVAASVLLLIAAISVGRASSQRQFSCEPPRRRMAAIWSADESAGSPRGALHARFLASGLSDGGGIWRRLATVLDDRLNAWSGMYREACEATHVRGEQSPTVLDLRMTCLNDALSETRAYTSALQSADAETLSRAVPGALALAGVQRCADVASLRLQVPLPTDPAVRLEVEKLQERLKEAHVLLSLDHPSDAERRLTAIVREARALPYRPALGQALVDLSLAQGRLVKLDEARQTSVEALAVAESARDDLTAVVAADGLCFTATSEGQYGEAERWLTFGEAVIERLHAGGSLVASWILNERGNLHYRRGEFSAAEAAYQRSLDLKRKLLGPLHPDVGVTLSNLALALEELDRLTDAWAAVHTALAIQESQGEGPSVMFANNLVIEAETLHKQGRLDDAQRDIDRASRVDEAQPYKVERLTAEILELRGELLIDRHRPAEAMQLLKRAKALQAHVHDQDPIALAEANAAMGRAIAAAHGNARRARDLAFGACQVFERSGYESRKRSLISWFDQLDGPHARGARSCDDLRPLSSPTGRTLSAG
jgi:hypothetical protein